MGKITFSHLRALIIVHLIHETHTLQGCRDNSLQANDSWMD